MANSQFNSSESHATGQTRSWSTSRAAGRLGGRNSFGSGQALGRLTASCQWSTGKGCRLPVHFGQPVQLGQCANVLVAGGGLLGADDVLERGDPNLDFAESVTTGSLDQFVVPTLERCRADSEVLSVAGG
jgi:hypothetical protein